MCTHYVVNPSILNSGTIQKLCCEKEKIWARHGETYNLRKQKQVDLYEFKVSLVYIESSRPTSAA